MRTVEINLSRQLECCKMRKSDFQNKDVGLNKGAKIAPSSGAVALLKPHGKYFGMDTFSCLNPDLDVLEKTIMNFPFDLLWIGNQNEIKGFLDSRCSDKMKISQFILYGDYDIGNSSSDIIVTPLLSDAIAHARACSFKPGILLFTASDSDSAFSIRFFDKQVINSQSTP